MKLRFHQRATAVFLEALASGGQFFPGAENAGSGKLFDETPVSLTFSTSDWYDDVFAWRFSRKTCTLSPLEELIARLLGGVMRIFKPYDFL